MSFLKNTDTGFGSGPGSSSSSLIGGNLNLPNTGFLSKSSIETTGGPVTLPMTPETKIKRRVSSTNGGTLAPITVSSLAKDPVAISYRTIPKQRTSQ